MNEPVIPERQRLNKGDLFWLFYLVFFLIEPLAKHSVRLWVGSGVCLLVFLGLYLGFMLYARTALRMVFLAAMFALGVIAFPFNSGSTCFMIYSAALLPFTLSSLPWIISGFVLESGVLAFECWRLHVDPFNWFIGTLLIVGVGGSNIFFAQRQRADCKLRRKQEEIEALAAVAERERIARDLHDVLGHTLSVIVLKAELAKRLLERESHEGTASPDLLRACDEITEVERTARSALAEVREAIGGYRARGLMAEVQAARQTLATAGVTLVADGDLTPSTLTAAEETVLALALREAVTNIVRHAQATTCRLRMVVEGGQHRLWIEDNGRHTGAREGNGLRGMRERVESLGGQLSLTREGGTLLLIELPERTPATP